MGRKIREMTALVEREGYLYVSLCPHLDVANQGQTSKRRGRTSSRRWSRFSRRPQEAERRLASEFYVTRVEVAVG